MKHAVARITQLVRLNFCGLAIGTFFYCLALTPSLLPRPALLEGIIAGLSFAIGYSLGVFASWLARQAVHKELSRRFKQGAWITILIAMPILVVAYGLWSVTWQNEVRDLVAVDELAGQHIVTIFAVAFGVAAIVISIGRLIGWAIRTISAFVGRWVPTRISTAIGVLIVGVLLVLFYNDVLFRTFAHVTNNMYRGRNTQTAQGVTMPTSPLRSGSKESLVRWDTLGIQGRSFTAGGPSQSEIAHFSGQAPTEPIRVYVGLNSAPDVQTRARLAVDELERTGAFSRPVLAVMTTTGTGWIEPQSAAAFEYMWNGNTAVATMQYSYLPSWISFLVDKQNATEAGKTLFNTIYERWQQLPADNRPKLLVYGLSLGSFGGQSAFSGVADLQNRTDGALFMGTPNDSQPWSEFTAQRDPGSPQWQPIYQNGQAVRFAAQSSDLSKPQGPWGTPRIVYLQHASDPVVWWSPKLIWHKPTWLSEKRGPDVSPKMQWYPFVTFLQVTVDQFFAAAAQNGHGHNYIGAEVAAWSAIAPPDGWTNDRTSTLQAIMNAAEQ